MQQSARGAREYRERELAASILFRVGAVAMVTGALVVLWPEGPSATVTPNGETLVGYRGSF
jgi:hypothetical protein